MFPAIKSTVRHDVILVSRFAFQDLCERGDAVFFTERGHSTVTNVRKESRDLGLNVSSAS